MIIRVRPPLALCIPVVKRSSHRQSHLQYIHDSLLHLSVKQCRMASTTSAAAITADPKAGQSIEHEGRTYTTVREGRAFILVPPNAQTSVDPQAKPKAGEHVPLGSRQSLACACALLTSRLSSGDGLQVQNVFYNPIQQFNRDLSVLAIKAFGDDSCQRKKARHDENHAKEKRKKNNKRKRGAATKEDHDAEEHPSKLQRSDNVSSDAGLYVPTSNDAPNTMREEEAEDGAEAKGTRGTAVGTVKALEAKNEAKSEVAVLHRTTEAVEQETLTDRQHVTTNDGIQSISNGHEGQKAAQKPWRPRFRILDALSATGLRALRYASEISFATAVVANDRERSATNSIKMNVEHNRLGDLITATTEDALRHMYTVAFPSAESHGPTHVSRKYDVIDLDPYGTAAPFIDAALQSLEDGGMLCVTCTDSGVWASCGYSEKTYALYGGMPIKGLHSHEGGIRLIIHSVATSAAKYGMSIEPLLSLSIDFYARMFIRVRKSPLDVKFLPGKTMLVYGCDHGCGAWSTQFIGRHVKHKNSDVNWKYSIGQGPSADRACEHCGSKTHLAGPMWGGPLHNPAFVEKMLNDLRTADASIYQTKPRIEGMLDTALDELLVNPEIADFRDVPVESKNSKSDIVPKTPVEAIDNHPFFFIPSALCKVIKSRAPPEILIKGALRHAGYRATRSHCKPGSIKTDAPWAVIWEILREWVRQKSPIKDGSLQENSPGWKIMQACRTVKPDGDEGSKDSVNGDANGNTTSDGTPDIVTEDRASPPKPRPSDPSNLKDLKVVFDEQMGKDKPGKRLVRYQENPRENWGPMRKAQGSH